MKENRNELSNPMKENRVSALSHMSFDHHTVGSLVFHGISMTLPNEKQENEPYQMSLSDAQSKRLNPQRKNVQVTRPMKYQSCNRVSCVCLTFHESWDIYCAKSFPITGLAQSPTNCKSALRLGQNVKPEIDCSILAQVSVLLWP